MKPPAFDSYFEAATGKRPYGYQCRLACGPAADLGTPATLQPGAACQSQLISIPTGLGKTAGVVLAWLWNRVGHSEGDHRNRWPRRLVYCLPMRTLVEQTHDNVREWLKNLGGLEWDGAGPHANKVGLHILMGGEDSGEWDLYPEENAVLIGTQDMLLSRALNRGYGMSRYRWPMQFGLLNNDALWVMDETQLMGAGLSTACQLESFRASNASSYGSFGAAGSVTWYMSATSNREHLNTREWRNVARPNAFDFTLSLAEKATTPSPIQERRFAAKRLELEPDAICESLIDSILTRHEDMVRAIAKDSELPARTLIICNTVDRAVSVHAQVAARKPADCELLLLHSRFRPPERREQMNRLKATNLTPFWKAQIVVATQVIEAGVDISSAILYSEIAPLSSLVQRLGRLNRSGEFRNSGWEPVAIIAGVGVEAAPPRETQDDSKKREGRNVSRCLPYELSTCESAWESLRTLNDDASPASLAQVQDSVAASIPQCPYSLQRYELIDFFDTDANLSLGFTDVSPFVRSLDDDTDLQVCWREAWSANDGPPEFIPNYQRDELCSVPISKAKEARDVLNRGWLWRGRESGWISVQDAGIAPGMTILLPLSGGGYDNPAGWTGKKDDNKHASHYRPKDESSDEEQLSCLANGWRSIAAHTTEVASELEELLGRLFAPNENRQEHKALLDAAPWHDIGKNHTAWQKAVLDALEKAGIAGKDKHRPFAKFSLSECSSLAALEGETLKKRLRELRHSFRPGIAHEVASALAFRAHEQARLDAKRDTNLASLLAEYVIMSHHGRVRKVLRDEIPRFPKDGKDADTVRGISENDALPAVVIEGQSLGCNALTTDCRRMGRAANGHESYTRGILRLLNHYGPFRLAFLEAVFRAADIRASITASQEHRA